jgi:hypothetical protein
MRKACIKSSKPEEEEEEEDEEEEEEEEEKGLTLCTRQLRCLL